MNKIKKGNTRFLLHFIKFVFLFFSLQFYCGVTYSDVLDHSSVVSKEIQWNEFTPSLLTKENPGHKNLFLFLQSTWCHWCRQMEDTTFKNEEVIQFINANYFPVSIDIDINKNILLQYQITTIPTIILLDSNKKIIKKLSGYLSSEKMIQNLKLLNNEKIKLLLPEKKIKLFNNGMLLPEKKIHITIVGNKADSATEKLYKSALAYAGRGVEIEILNAGEKSKHSSAIFPVLNKPAAFVCTSTSCSIPAYTPIELSRVIEDKLTSIPNQSLSSDTVNEAKKLLASHNLILILMGFWLFGLLLAFTPCVLPLIIIMAGLLGGKTGSITRLKAVYLTLTYILSLSLTYAIAGFIAAFFGFYIQAYLQQPWILILVSLIFTILALSLLGFYKLQLPAKLRHRIVKFNKLQDNYTYVQVGIMGVVATLIASPCAAAPLLGVLSYVGTTGNIMLGSISLFFVGLGIGTPLLIATTACTSLIPNVKIFQDFIKMFFGLIMMGMAIWLLDPVIPKWWSMVLWSALVIYTSVLMVSLHQTQETNFWRIWKTISFMILAYGIALFLGGLLGNINPLNPLKLPAVDKENYTVSEISFNNINNFDDFKKMSVIGQKQGKPILLIFGAEWCKACKELEDNFSDSEIKKLLQQFMLLKIDLTDNSKFELAKKFNVIAPPAVIFFDGGKKLDFGLYGNTSPLQIKEILQQVLNK